MTHSRLIHRFILILLLGCLASGAAAADGTGGPVYTTVFSDVAVGGYDTPAFFTERKPVKGSKRFEFEHRGATWRFVSAANLNKFKADPTKYAPQYGGFCAWAMASGDQAPGKAPYWSIVEEKLYLNYSKSVQDKWLMDVDGFIAKANQAWPTVQE